MADLPIELAAGDAERLVLALDRERKIQRAFEALGPVANRDVVLVDAAVGIRARQLSELGARLTLLERDGARVVALRAGVADLAGVTIAEGTCGRTNLPDDSADVVITCWSAFRDDQQGELDETERVLRADGRLLVLHDYGRDDVSRLRGRDLPEYGAWSRRDGWFLRHGFKVRVLHCWWTFETIEDARVFLGGAFAGVGREVGDGLRRPRLSYNVAIYHRTRGGIEASEGA